MLLIRVITDGKAGDLTQCLGVAEAVVAAVGGSIEERVVKPRRLYALAMPWGPPDPGDEGAIAPPFPDIAIASGRRAVASLRVLKRRAPGCFTVFLKDPRTGWRAADLIWVPEHDRLRGETVVRSLTSPHRVTPERLAAAALSAREALRRLPRPRVAVLIGGPSKDVSFGPDEGERLTERLARLAAEGGGLMVTGSRRTPPALMARIRSVLADKAAWIWDGTGDNPYLEVMALADAFVVTADSVNMVGEAASTGRPILVFEPRGLNPKVSRFLDGLIRHGAVAKFHGHLETLTYEPLDSTPLVAREILERYHRFSSR